MGALETDAAVLQQRTLAAYLAMSTNVESWARRLVMLTASEAAAPLALAVMASGATVLWVCRSEAILRESSLSGLTDFQVTTLSEALRILKNEIRKGLPVSVGLLDAPSDVWAEAVRRGVQPDAVFAEGQNDEAVATLLARGSALLAPGGRLTTPVHVAANWRERRSGDAALLTAAGEIADPERTVALRWLRSAPRLFPRDFNRFYAAGWRLHPTLTDAGITAG